MFGAFPNLTEEKEATRPPGQARACVLKRGSTTWCGRVIDDAKEHVLHDAAHAVKNYAGPGPVQACPDCVRLARPSITDIADQSPMSTQGLRDDR